jgi:3-hydroxyisobutyrate dehydrogenase
MTRVAFNGLGTMGSGMAAHLLAAGFEVTVYNRTPAAAERLGQAGARVAATPAEAAAHADAVITMVSDDRASREVWTGARGALSTAKKGTLLIDSGTISPAWVRELAALAQARGCDLLDAPVTGSRPQAEKGELFFLVGGSAEAFERARPVLQPMSRGMVHLGPSGSGATMKLINNFVCGVQAAGLAEAVAWIERSGLEPEQAVCVLTEGAPGSPLVKALASRMMKRSYDVNFRLDLMTKDLRYATSEAQQSGVELAAGKAALAQFERAVDRNLGGLDLSAVVEPFRNHE